ncbi:hypothetical protein JTE90_020388 [Oedothorax gibbosus]|uniref:dTCF n=1 Tax=Oedothorax gibbosus TaxID=931172 RepID=A0AAV6UFE4_9ARAC|nr:hypothetical protein JTE90_020388 [Oedothorax gibbosus]
MPRASVFPLSPSQFHPPHVFPPEYTQQYSWHPSSMYPVTSGFRSPPYPLALSPLIHPLMPPVPNKQERTPDNQDGRPFSGVTNGNTHQPQQMPPSQPQQQQQTQQRRAPRSNGMSEKKKNHIKKPLNAFMLFMKEQRPRVVSECTLKESAAINQILGKKWHGLSREEQSKYYEMARSERQLHMQRYPGWTARDNYAINAKKKKRKRDKSTEGDGNNPKKCRARFGLDKQSSWCKPCRRKKKCIRYRSGSDNTAGESEDNVGSVGSAQTPDSRYGAEEEDDDDVSDDTDSGNEDDVSSEFSLSSPPLRPPSLDRIQAQPLGSPPSQQSSHPLNVQLLSQPHMSTRPAESSLHLQRLSQMSDVPRTVTDHQVSMADVQMSKTTTESHLQRLGQMSDTQSMSRTAKDHQVPMADVQMSQKTTDSHLQRLGQMSDPQSMLRTGTDHSLSQQAKDAHVPRTMADPQMSQKNVDPLMLQRTADPQVTHCMTDPQVSRTMTEPQMSRTMTEPRVLYNNKDSQLRHLNHVLDPPRTSANCHLEDAPVIPITKDPQTSYHSKNLSRTMVDPQKSYHSKPHPQQMNHVSDPHLIQPHQMTNPQLPRFHLTNPQLPGLYPINNNNEQSRSNRSKETGQLQSYQPTNHQSYRPNHIASSKELLQSKDTHQLSQMHHGKDIHQNQSAGPLTDLQQSHKTTDQELPLSLSAKDPHLQRLPQTLQSMKVSHPPQTVDLT